MERGAGDELSFFVGREPEIRALFTAVRDAHAGRGRPVLVVGEPGIGKTRTVEELTRRLTLDESRVVWGRSPEQEGVPAFWPWLQVLRRHLDRCADDRVAVEFGPDAPVLARLLPGLRERLPGLAEPPRADASQSRFLLFEAVAATLRRAAALEPVVVVLEDLHWADEASLLLLLFVADEMRGARFAVVGTCRPKAAWRLRALFDDLAQRSQLVDVGGLQRDDVERFVARAGAAPPPALVEELHAATGGNPFFLGEVVQQLLRDGRAPAALDPESLRPSDGVRAFIRRHLEPLAPDELRQLTIAAVLGREFDSTALAAVAETDPSRALAALAAPAALRLIEPGEGSGRFRFAHALIRETLYGDLSPLERAHLHLAAARALEHAHQDTAEPPVAEIAFHFYHAAPLGHVESAVAYAARAGERAVAQLAFEDGVLHFERALAVLSLHEPRDRDRLRLQLALGNAALRAGDAVKARASFEAALRLARAVGDPASFARAAYGVGGTRVEANSADPVLIAALEEALAMSDPHPGPERAALLARLATALYFTPEGARREALSAEAVAMARAIGEPTTLAAALITRHFMLWGSGPIEERLALADEAIALASAAGHRGLVLEARTWRLADLLEQGSLPALERELGHYVHDAGATRFSKHRRYALGVRAMLATHDGSFAEAERLIAEARATPERRQDTSIEQVHLSQVFHARRESGGDLASIAAAIAEQARIQRSAPSWRAGYALVELELGRPERARALIAEVAAEASAPLRQDGNLAQTLAYCAEAVAWLDEPALARRVYELLQPFDGRNVAVGSPPVGSLGAAARYLGLAAAAAGDGAQAIGHLEAAIAQNDRMAARPQAAHARVDLARVLLRRGAPGDGERAHELLAAALSAARALGMRPLVERIAALAPTAAAARTAPPAPDGAATLAGVGGNDADRAATRARDDDRSSPATEIRASCRREGDFWTIVHAGRTSRIRDAKGLAILQLLLRHPGREIHVLELETGMDAAEAVRPSASRGGAAASLAASGLVAAHGGDAGEMLDAGARDAYRARVAELEAESAGARDAGDTGRAADLERELEFIRGELSRGFGLGGRTRRAASASERARLNVSRSVSRVLRRIAELDPELGRHLAAAVRTGNFCSYTPDPAYPVRWEL